MKFTWFKSKSDEDPVVRSFVHHHVHSPETFAARIDKDDEMYLFDLQVNKGDRRRTSIGYYTTGSRIFGAIKQIAEWHFDGLRNVGSFLDFASGYGRSTRFLSRELPPGRIWACDIYPRAVEFQKRHYGVNGVLSVPDPADFPDDPKFDFIFASSFFSHMPETTFGTWIETLLARLNPDGILVFSTHDVSLIPPTVPIPANGILFLASSESRTLDTNQYGSTYVSEEFVARVVDWVSRGKVRLHRIRRGLCYFQDLYILAGRQNRDFLDLNFLHDPVGHLDTWQNIPSGEAYLAGWAADFNAGGSIKEIQIRSGGKVIETVTPDQDRPDVAKHFQCPSATRSGWTCRLKSHPIRPNDIVEITTINHAQRKGIIAYDLYTSIIDRCKVAG